MMDESKRSPKLLNQPGKLAAVLIVVGAVAWTIALIAIALALLDEDDTGLAQATADSAEVDVAPLPPTTNATLAAVAITVSPSPTLTPLPTATFTVTPRPTAAVTRTPDPTQPVSAAAPPVTREPKATLSVDDRTPMVEVAAADCSPPADWEQYVVQPEDTLFAFVLGAEGEVTVEELMAANCLESRYLMIDQVLYLPPGAADNAPPSQPYVPPDELYATGQRTPNCPCTIRVIEGWRREQIAAAINNMEVQFTSGDFLAATDPGVMTSYDVVNQRPADSSMEGFLFPGTYTLQNDTTAVGFRDMLLASFVANVTPQMQADAAAQGVTFYEALIIASIVQREVRTPSYQPLVASIYYNRYRAGSRLGTTVTLQYALGGPGAWWPWVKSVNFESPYNTYNRPGLPPTPIDSPGMGALQAAIYPPQTNYYYHNVACDGSGEVFSETYEEHLKTVNCDE